MRTDLVADWEVPRPSGALDRVMGPGKTRAETVTELSGGLVAAALIAWHVWGDFTGWQLAVVAILALDLAGGVMTNATNSAKRWYHRSPKAKPRLMFVTVHIAHLAAVVFLGGTWLWFATNAALLLASALLIEGVPVAIRRPTAMAAYMAFFLLNLGWLPAPLAWFPALFYLKLLVCHLVPEAPLRDR
ncbi:hypothetical protein [Longispora albida]|uniref:hypothetical protein n=1 Tax=Longispora albida TaxID=203523 RepID=UPI0003AA8427|nr:hypothetical protein [Longispora albida]